MDKQHILDEILSPESKSVVPPPVFCRFSDEELSATGDYPPPYLCRYGDEELSAASPRPCAPCF
ncbi:MAG: hypothetical protein RBS99_01615 [Rhodospirillales bacterium]|jgi:hypothetical protein|nr:hypothetical protein [Rhodospirillales bacterium]